MAFNPFTSFRKYQKFWMASLVLLSMITFVLCTGLGQGGLEDIILGVMGRNQGSVIATLHKRAVYKKQLDDLKEQRTIANDYMREAVKISIAGLEQRQKDAAKINNKAQQEKETRATQTLLLDLHEVQHRPRYFDGDPGSLDDLLDFLLWQHEADRLGIRLEDKQVMDELSLGVHAYGSRAFREGGWVAAFNNIRYGSYQSRPNEKSILDALRQEYRVQIARLAMLGARTFAQIMPNSVHLQRRMDVRLVLSPDQMWEHYSKNRTPMDMALVPVAAEPFVAKVAEPNKIQLETLYDQYRTVKYDPASPLPGFVAPAQVKLAWVTADPKSPIFQGLARFLTTLDSSVPVAGAPSLAPVAWRASLEQNYDNIKNRANPADRYEDLPLSEPYTILHLAWRLYQKPAPEVVAATVGAAALPGVAAPALYQSAAYANRPEGVETVVEQETRRRWPVGVSAVLGASSPLPLAAPWSGLAPLYQEEQFLPFAVVEKELREGVEYRLATRLTRHIMGEVRKELAQDRGNGRGMELRLAGLLAKYPGLEVHRTSEFRTSYDVARDPDLKGLFESFEKYREQINVIEGRGGTERVLREDDFSRLFFGGEAFSVGNTSAYDPRPWPPVVTPTKSKLGTATSPFKADESDEAAKQPVDFLWREADRPILFWKTEAEPDRVPKGLADVRAEVVHAWKLRKAREDFALPRAREIAQALRKLQTQAGADYFGAMALQAKDLGTQLITLPSVTPLVPVRQGELLPPDWVPYKLPKGLIPYAAPGMTKHLLALRDLKAPVVISMETADKKKADLDVIVKGLNELNRQLFDANLARRKPDARQIQVLTNQPRTVFYVAAAVRTYAPSSQDFVDVWRQAVERPSPETLIDQGQAQAGREFEQRFIRELRRQAGVDEEYREGVEGGVARKLYKGQGES